MSEQFTQYEVNRNVTLTLARTSMWSSCVFDDDNLVSLLLIAACGRTDSKQLPNYSQRDRTRTRYITFEFLKLTMIYCDIQLTIPEFEKECKIDNSHGAFVLEQFDQFLKEGEEFCDAILVATVPEQKM